MNFDGLTKTISTTYTSSLFILLKTIRCLFCEDWDEVKLMYEALDSRKTLLKRTYFRWQQKNCGFKNKIQCTPWIEWSKNRWKCKSETIRIVQNNVTKAAARHMLFYFKLDYKMFFRLFVSEETNPHWNVSIVTVTLDVFYHFPKLHPFPRTNEYHRKSTPYYLLLWVIKIKVV
jgi:hypothetical protein